MRFYARKDAENVINITFISDSEKSIQKQQTSSTFSLFGACQFGKNMIRLYDDDSLLSVLIWSRPLVVLKTQESFKRRFSHLQASSKTRRCKPKENPWPYNATLLYFWPCNSFITSCVKIKSLDVWMMIEMSFLQQYHLVTCISFNSKLIWPQSRVRPDFRQRFK